ncbi:hypothetical protein SAMN05216232_1362 [Virgibacillus subterraneus]|uniref:DUF4209 domain-containing protein n=1 Tax=Virgibacillus subterraneus TaxID=621109 RepID=A0A1H9BX24_9BACI|nr:hypothetical protein [Virgibacillus subterraneus]SEP93281.1 hypothetical protein SAMN05216232_1362 [Virgibacillus subterraneus]
MSLLSKLYDEKRVLINLEKYELSDLSTSNTIRDLIDNFFVIERYYKTTNFDTLSNLTDYIDFIFLKYITRYSDDSDYLHEPYKTQLKELIAYTEKKINKVENSSLIQFINDYYIDIFEYDQKYHKYGLRKMTLDLIIKFYNGVKYSGVLEYLIQEHPIFIYDNFNKLLKVFKKENGNLLKLLLLDEKNFNKLCEYRFENICDTAEWLNNVNKEIALELGKKILSYIDNQYFKKEQSIYYLQKLLHRAIKTLYLLRIEGAKSVENYIRLIDKEVEEYLTEHGQQFQYEISTEVYDKFMSELDKKGVGEFSKYMAITHWIDTNNLWYSRLEKRAKEYKSSLIDYVGSSFETNSYFTVGKLNTIDILINSNSMALFYWFRDDKRIEEFKKSVNTVLECIFAELNYDTKYDSLEDDVNALITILSDINKNINEDVFYHIKSIFVISFLEKILRMIYLCIDEDAFFDKSKITLGTTIGNSKNSTSVLCDLIGEHHHRWTRYYFLTEDQGIGFDLRNRLAHLRDIRMGEINLPIFIKIVWLTISTLNSIFVNLVNNKDKYEGLG